MRAALVGATDCNTKHLVSTQFDYCIAVDAGWETCQAAGITPDVVLGDFDSLGFVPQGVPVAQFPHIKDESDMELAFMHAQEQGAQEVYVYGALAGRLDHTLANLQLFAEGAKRGIGVVGIGSDFAVVALAAGNASAGNAFAGKAFAQLSFDAFDPLTLSGSYAPYISLFALGGSAQGVHISGLMYEVEDFCLPATTSRGLSNEFTGKDACITFAQGCLLVVFPLDALSYAHF